ncbi:MAG: HAD family hydrolase, partial [Peptostreptococcus stomatis]
MTKAIFFDIDGTLLSMKTHKVRESTRRSLEELRKKEIKLFLATGRSPAWL